MELAPRIDVEINPDFFVFTYGEEKLTVPALISFDIVKKVPDANGERLSGPGIITVTLLSAEQNPPPVLDKLDLLSNFFEYHFAQFSRKRIGPVFRPKVVIHGDEKLTSALGGYQRSLIKMAALVGGAKEVVFDY
jgi:hypothetical protein